MGNFTVLFLKFNLRKVVIDENFAGTNSQEKRNT
jgi:hypothetical protein